MRWHLLAIGRPKLVFAKAGVDEYAKRIAVQAALTLQFLKPSAQETKSAALLRPSEGMFRVVLDERGEQVTSHVFAEKITAWENRGVKTVALLMGGADGHSDEVRAAADWRWSLSRLTLQHELALVVLLEQLYRAYAIKSGSPYHRD